MFIGRKEELETLDKEIGDGRRNQATQGDWTGDHT